jgi:hypothetical protein
MVDAAIAHAFVVYAVMTVPKNRLFLALRHAEIAMMEVQAAAIDAGYNEDLDIATMRLCAAVERLAKADTLPPSIRP